LVIFGSLALITGRYEWILGPFAPLLILLRKKSLPAPPEVHTPADTPILSDPDVQQAQASAQAHFTRAHSAFDAATSERNAQNGMEKKADLSGDIDRETNS